jgi:single-strand DNA-binding protein
LIFLEKIEFFNLALLVSMISRKSLLNKRRIKMRNQNLAYVFADGNLTSDPESKKTSGGKSLTTFTIAVNHSFKQDDNEDADVSYFDVDTWEKMAENCGEYLKKGSKVTVIGLLKQDRWKSSDGTFRSKVKISAQQVRFDYTGIKKDKKAA